MSLLYPTLSQPVVFVAIFAAGICSGLFFDGAAALTKLSGGDRASKIFFEFLATIFAFALLFFTNLATNFGQFRLFVLVSFLLAVALERTISFFLWTKLLKRCYSKMKEKQSHKRAKRSKEETS